MTQEEKAKAYDEALEKARKRVSVEPQDHTDAILKDIFPQLRESEDERIAEELIKALRGISAGLQYAIFLTEEKKQRWLAWLGKQKEQKPAEWSEEDNEMRLEAIRVLESGCERYRKESGCLPSWHKVINWLKSLRPIKQEWSKKDEDKLYQVMETLLADKTVALRDNPHCKALHEAYDEMLDWLKSLRPSWKPSEEQMEALQHAIDACENEWAYQDDELRSLLNDLNKL